MAQYLTGRYWPGGYWPAPAAPAAPAGGTPNGRYLAPTYFAGRYFPPTYFGFPAHPIVARPTTILTAIKAALLAQPGLSGTIAADVGFTMPPPGSQTPYMVVTKTRSSIELFTNRTRVYNSTVAIRAYAESPMGAYAAAQQADGMLGLTLDFDLGFTTPLVEAGRNVGKEIDRGKLNRFLYYEEVMFCCREVRRG